MSSTFINVPSYSSVSWKDPVASIGLLPTINNTPGDARVTSDTGTVWVWNGASWNAPMAGSVSWGTIGGILSNQTDLQTVLNGKQPAGNYITDTTGDVVATGPGSVPATIQPNVVTDNKLRQGSKLSVIGRSSNTAGNVADINAPLDNNRPYLRATDSLFWDNDPNDFQGRDWDNLSALTTNAGRMYVRIPEHIFNARELNPAINYITVYKNGVELAYPAEYSLINAESLSGKKIFTNGEVDADPQYLVETVVLTNTYDPGDVFRVVYKEWRKSYSPVCRLSLYDYFLQKPAVLPKYAITFGTGPFYTRGAVIQKSFPSTPNSIPDLPLTIVGDATFDSALETYTCPLTYSDGLITQEGFFVLPNCVSFLDYPTNYDFSANNLLIEAFYYQQNNSHRAPTKRLTPVGYSTQVLSNMSKVFVLSQARNGKRVRQFKFRIRNTSTNTVSNWSELTVLVKNKIPRYSALGVKIGKQTIIV